MTNGCWNKMRGAKEREGEGRSSASWEERGTLSGDGKADERG